MQQKQLIAIILVIAVVAAAAVGAVFLMKGGSSGDTKYTVTYNTNGGNEIAAKEFTKNTDTFDLATPTKDGSTFLGWYLNADFSGDKITQVAKGTEKNITVYAKWQLDLANNTLPSAAQITANTDVKVTFDSGATDKTIPAAAVDELKAGKTLEVEDTVNKLTWTMSGSDSKQTGYADQAMDTTVTPDTSLLASEKKITLDFAYDGTLPYESTIRYFIGTDVFPAGTLISIQNSGEAEPIGQFPVDAEGYVTFTITHCSDWVLTQYITLTLDGNGGTFTISEQTVATTTVGGNYNSDVPVLPVPSRTGYGFEPWVSPVKFTEDATLTAQWTAYTYQVVFNKNSDAATGTMAAQDMTYDTEAALIANAFSNDGYSFAGWATTADGAVVYTDGQTVRNLTDVKEGTVNLYAKWTVNQYNAVVAIGSDATRTNLPAGWINNNDGSFTKAFDYGTAVTAIIADFGVTPVKEYYTFEAWSPNSGTIGTEGITITAGYVLQNFTIAFSVNGGSGSVASIQNVKLGDTIDQPAYTGTRAGYENAGSWCYDEYGSLNVPFTEGQLNVSGAVLDYAENNTVTFYAKWTQISYTVTFNLNTGSGNVPSDLTNKHYGDTITLARPTASKDTKFFGGWNTKADGTGTNYSAGNVTIDNAFVEFAQGTTVTLYINWVDGLYTATLGDIFGGHTYYYNQGGDQIGSVEFRAMVIRADASTYDIEMMFNEQGTWIADSYMTIAQGNYPQLYGDSNDSSYAVYLRQGDHFIEPVQVSFNGVTNTVYLDCYTRDMNGVTVTMAEDADLTCFYMEMEMGGGGMEYSHSKQVIETVLTGTGNGYTPTPIAVQYKASQNAQTSIPYSSANYQTPEAIGMAIPDGMEFRGWMLMDDDYDPEGDNPMLTTAHAVGCARTVYAVFTEIVLTPTNIDWEVHNLPAGITLTINGEDAYESDGSPSYPLIFTGGTNWSKEEVNDGQYCYTFTLDQTVYHAQIRKGNSTHITENPDGDRMRVAFNALGDGQRYSITIYFWMDDPLMGGYMPTVNDSFTYHEESFISGETTYTVEEVSSDYSYDATDGNRSYVFGPFLYPQDNYIVYLLNSEVTDNQGAGLYTHRISTETFLNGQVECYVMENSVYQRYWNQSTEKTVRTETMVNQGFYGKDNGLLYQYNNDAIAHFTVTLTSKPAQMRSVTQYEAVLDGNGGTFGGEPTTVRDYSFTFNATTPRWNDHALTGWNTQANGNGRSYVEGDVFNPADLVEGRIVLYAQWMIDGFYLDIIADAGGTPESATREVLYSDMNHGEMSLYFYEFPEITAPNNKATGSYRVESLNPAFESVMFMEPVYSFTPNGDGTYRYGGDSNAYYKFGNKDVYYYLFEYDLGGGNVIRNLTVAPLTGETVDIYLVWTEDITAVTFHSNYGDQVQIINYANANLYSGYFPSGDIFAKQYYSFIGWGPTADADPDDTIGGGEPYATMMGTEFWAIWNYSGSYTVNFCNSEDPEDHSMSPVVRTMGDRQALPPCTLTPPEGKVFYNWRLNDPDEGRDIENGSTEDLARSELPVTLYAIWDWE